jgi:hypothetical protein
MLPIERSCPTGKRTYDKKAAVSQINRERKRVGGKKLHVYHCVMCNHWHIGREVDYIKGYKRR